MVSGVIEGESLTAAKQVIGEFNWHLLSEAELAQRAAEVLAQTPGLSPRRACQNIYSVVLCESCRDSDRCRQEQAYTELHTYLYRIAYHRWPEIAEDAAQEAIWLVFRDIAKVKKPGAFLYFAWCKLLHAIQRVKPDPRQIGNLPAEDLVPWRQPENYLEGDKRVAKSNRTASPDAPFPWDGSAGYWTDSINDDLADKLWNCLRSIWTEHPRARDQIRAFMWKHYDDLSEAEICQRLNQTPAQVQVLRSRAKRSLRKCLN